MSIRVPAHNSCVAKNSAEMSICWSATDGATVRISNANFRKLYKNVCIYKCTSM